MIFSLYIIKGLERLVHYFEKKLFTSFVRNWGGRRADVVNSEPEIRNREERVKSEVSWGTKVNGMCFWKVSG